MELKSAQLKDGAEWVEHEDCIVGNEAGLKNLINACKTAIEKGEFYGPGLGDYVGVKKMKSNWFKKPIDSISTRFANHVLALVLFLLLALIVIGFISTLKWLF